MVKNTSPYRGGGVVDGDIFVTGAINAGTNINLRTDNEGGNITFQGPNNKQLWEMNNWNDNQFRLYCKDLETDELFFPFTVNKNCIYGVTNGNVPFYTLNESNVDIPPAPSWNGGFSMGAGIMTNNRAILSFNLGWILLQFSVGNVSLMVRTKFGNNPWSDWRTI